MLVCRVTLGRLLSWPWRSGIGKRRWTAYGEMLRYTDEEYPDTNALVRHRGAIQIMAIRTDIKEAALCLLIHRLSCTKFSVCCALNCANACSKEPRTNWSIYLFLGGSLKNWWQTHQTFAWEGLGMACPLFHLDSDLNNQELHSRHVSFRTRWSREDSQHAANSVDSS